MRNDVEKYVGHTVEGVAGLSTTALMTVNPELAIGFELIKPGLVSITTELLTGLLNSRQKNRIVSVNNDTINKIKKNFENPLKIYRGADYYADSNNQHSAEEIYEGVLLHAKDEYIDKKLPLYSSFYANLAFEPLVSYEEANTILHLIHELSYTQIKLLGYIHKNGKLHCLSWDVGFKDIPQLYSYYNIYTDCKTLYNNTLIMQDNASRGIMVGMGNMILSPLGVKFSKLVDLSTYVEIGMDSLTNEIEAIYTLIQSHGLRSK